MQAEPEARQIAAPAEPIIEISGLNLTYAGGDKALSDVNLTVERGEFLLVTGASGCGKTTLARCLNGLIPHLIAARVEGKIRVAGLNPVEEEVAQMASRVGMVFQVPEAQLFNLTVEEEVAFGCQNLGLAPDEVEERVAFALAAVGIEAYRNRTLYQMSGGEKQLVAIASVLAMRPEVLVLDEPLSDLDGKGVLRVLDVLGRLNASLGISVVLIEHRTHQVADAANRVVVMDEGRIVLDGKPEALNQEQALLKRLGVRVPGDIQPKKVCTTLGSMEAEPVVFVQGVEFGYNGHPVLKGADLQVRRGEFVALVGDSGAGKTTLAHLIAGALRPKAGAIRVTGEGRGGQKIGLLLQNPSEQLFCDTVGEEVGFGPENYGRAVDGIVEEMLALTDLSRFRAQEVQHLSRGQQQRLALAAVLALRPEVLILDEPTLGQDWGHLTRFMDFVQGLQAQETTILLITHDVDVAGRYADRIVRLVDGKTIEGRQVSAMSNQERCEG